MCTRGHGHAQNWPAEAVCGQLLKPPPCCVVPLRQVAACCLSNLHLSHFPSCRASLGSKVCWKWPSATKDTRVLVCTSYCSVMTGKCRLPESRLFLFEK